MRSGTVLLVEDEILIRAILADLLKEEGYSVVQAGNVLEAMAALGRHPTFDAVITDIDMPGCLDGLDLAGMVRILAPRTKIIILSAGNASDSCPSDCHFLQKPYSVRQVVSLLGESMAISLGRAFRS